MVPPTDAVPRSFASRVHGTVASREVRTLIRALERLRSTGRPGYGARALVEVCVVKSLYGLPTWTRAVRLVAEHAALQVVLGAAPSAHVVYRFTKKLRRHWLLLRVV